MPITLNASTSSGLVTTPDNSGDIALQSSGTTELTVTSTGVSVADNLSFNSGYGSAAVAYGCRAWVNFNGQGTVAIRASGNVSSITDTGVGTYTVNLTNAMPDANYSVQSLADGAGIAMQAAASNTNGRTTSNYQVNTYNGALTPSFALSDFVAVMSAIFR